MTALPGADWAHEAGGNMKRTILSTNRPPRSPSAVYVLELRRLIHEDAYNTAHVADEIARRMLCSGDL